MLRYRRVLYSISITGFTSERGYNPETPYNFSLLYQSSMISAGWHAHLNYDWWRLPSGEAPLALYCWQTLGNMSLEFDESRLDHCWGNFGARLLQRPVHGPWVLSVVRGHEDKTYDICPSPWKSPRGKAYIEGNGRLGLGLEI